jgi:hypothetical protein
MIGNVHLGEDTLVERVEHVEGFNDYRVLSLIPPNFLTWL